MDVCGQVPRFQAESVGGTGLGLGPGFGVEGGWDTWHGAWGSGGGWRIASRRHVVTGEEVGTVQLP